MDIKKIKTLGALKKSGYRSRSIKEELRENLISKLERREKVFEGIYGFDETVLPDIERAILSRHNILLLGLRGQAKTRIARLLTTLLDEYMPIVAGSEINDDPLQPLSNFAVTTISDLGDKTPIDWVHRDTRYVEKLATPDVSIADLIGDIDPIKAATLKLAYSDERVLHFGLIPRAHRSIFVINELPDLQARIQVSLFNILQEGDLQIRGFKLRLPLDIQFMFTANPEDYTNRGSIVTPLKDRIGSQILTHYPDNVDTARTITAQEARLDMRQSEAIHVPDLAKDLLEQISFEARESEYVDVKSGVSARMSITAFQNLLSTAERRALLNGDKKTSIRLSDFVGIIPSITGKVELVYEGEQEGADFVANALLDNAIKTLFPRYFPKVEKLEKQGEETVYDDLISWFFNGDGFELLDSFNDADYKAKLDEVTPLDGLLADYQPDIEKEDVYFEKEFILWGLTQFKKLSKYRYSGGLQFKDPYGSYISGL